MLLETKSIFEINIFTVRIYLLTQCYSITLSDVKVSYFQIAVPIIATNSLNLLLSPISGLPCMLLLTKAVTTQQKSLLRKELISASKIMLG